MPIIFTPHLRSWKKFPPPAEINFERWEMRGKRISTLSYKNSTRVRLSFWPHPVRNVFFYYLNECLKSRDIFWTRPQGLVQKIPWFQGKNVLLIVANVLFFKFFLFICITLWNSRENFWRNPPPCSEKSGPPPAEKKIGPPPLGFWSSPTYDLI